MMILSHPPNMSTVLLTVQLKFFIQGPHSLAVVIIVRFLASVFSRALRPLIV